MKFIIIILLLFASLKSYGQLDTIHSSKPVLIRIGRPANDNSQPLFIIDGKPIGYDEFQNINPGTIESVTVLKDSLAENLFSGQARNGVIIIKTKKFSKREVRKMKKKLKDS